MAGSVAACLASTHPHWHARNVLQVRLRDHLASSLTFSKARDIELAWVDGSINMVVDKTDTSAAQEAAASQDQANKDKKADEDGESTGRRAWESGGNLFTEMSLVLFASSSSFLLGFRFFGLFVSLFLFSPRFFSGNLFTEMSLVVFFLRFILLFFFFGFWVFCFCLFLCFCFPPLLFWKIRILIWSRRGALFLKGATGAS